MEKFSALAAEWWDPKGKFRPLHKFNPIRLGFIRETVSEHFGLDAGSRAPFEGLRLLDIGCGGGLLSEPMARLGAQVTGVDAAAGNIKTAMTHAKEAGVAVDYRHGTAELLVDAGEPAFDVVLNMEVVEHVADVDAFMTACASLVKPGGLMIVATINRTPKAFTMAIFGAEYVMRWLPRGTHQYNKLVKPGEARAPLETSGLSVGEPIGVSFNPIAWDWRLSNDASVNYMLVAKRPAA